MTVKTAVATSPSMCQRCEKTAVRLMIYQPINYKPDVLEEVLCFDHVEELADLLGPERWVGEYL